MSPLKKHKHGLFDHRALLQKLDRVVYNDGPAIPKSEFEKLQLVDTLLLLADISHRTEYELCGEVAKRLLGQRPDPNEADADLE